MISEELETRAKIVRRWAKKATDAKYQKWLYGIAQGYENSAFICEKFNDIFSEKNLSRLLSRFLDKEVVGIAVQNIRINLKGLCNMKTKEISQLHTEQEKD